MPENTIPLERRDDDALATLARRSRADVAKESLALLVRRRSPAAPDLARELVSGHADPRVRALAAVGLGRLPAQAGLDALLGAVRDTDPLVVRRAAQSLVRVGDATALDALARARPADGPAARDVQAARMLLGYRLGRSSVLVTPPVDATSYGSRRGTEITFGGRARVARSDVLASVRDELPRLDVAEDSVRLFTCSGQPGALALDASLRGDGAAGLDRPRMLGALLRDRVCSERYSLDAYLLSDDRDGTGGARPRLWLVRPSGRLVHAGDLVVADGTVRFTVTRSVAPYAHPVKVVGSFDLGSGVVSVETALVGKPAARAVAATSPSPRAGRVR